MHLVCGTLHYSGKHITQAGDTGRGRMLVKLAKLVVQYMPTLQADLAIHLHATAKAMQY